MSTDLIHNFDIEDLVSDPNPLWLWDGIAGRIYWANDAGLDFWQTERLIDLQEMKFDHAMPALRRLRKLALKEVPDAGRDERLVFWTARGRSQVICNCVKIAVDGFGELLLLRLKGGWRRENDPGQSRPQRLPETPGSHPDRKQGADIEEECGKPGNGTKPPGNTATGGMPMGSTRNMVRTKEGDTAATLREIARQVRAESKFTSASDGPQPSIVAPEEGAGDASREPGEGHADAKGRSRQPGHPPSRDAPQPTIDEVDFLAKISHEIRTPLNSILGFSELMMQEQFGAIKIKKYAEYISDIHQSAELALSLINDMLDLSRMSVGQFDVTLERVDLNALTRAMLSIMRPQAEKNGITLKIELSIDELTINAGLRSVKQILLNLLSNAIKFTGPDGQVTLITGTEGDEWAFVKICDTGSGMTIPEIAKAMQPYAKLDTTPRHVEGTGLGLPITKALVDANGGTFKIESEPGEGTEISLRFRRNPVS